MDLGGAVWRRTFYPFFIVSCIGIGCLAVFSADRLRAIRVEGEQRTLWEESRLVYALVENDLREHRDKAVREKLQAISQAIGCRFTVIRGDGTVLADTEANPNEMENHRLRPEVVAAAAQGEGAAIRYSHTIQQDLIYLARREQDAEGNIYFVRLAAPVSKLNQKLQLVDMGLAVAAISIILLLGLAGLILAKRQSVPLAELAGMADALVQGDVTRRVHVGAGGQLGQLERDLNTIGATLADLRAKSAKARAELDAVLASMSDAVIATDQQQRVLLANAAAGTLLDASAAQSSGKMLWEIVQDEAVLKAAAQVASTGQSVTVQSEPRRGRHVEVTLSPLAHEGRNDGVLIVARDTTRTVTYQELRKEFVANVSHELRTPLTFIKGYVELLRDGAHAEPEKAANFLSVIDKHVNQLTNLVDDLLEISKLESRAGLPRRVQLNGSETVRKLAELFAPALAKKNQTLTLKLPAELPPISGDPDYLERALSNLIDNAIKYTPANGTITISASASGDKVTIQVADTGIGIPASDLQRVFERFYRVDKSRSREMGGTGLGLAIVKHIAQAHGGSVDVSSEVGKGTTFSITLPAA
jgi:two-component system phosphate regulon sensor histidine kinase PhoR